MERVFHFQDKAVFKDADGNLVNQDNIVLPRIRNAHGSTVWVTPDRNMAFGLTVERENAFSSSKLCFRDEKGLYHSFCMTRYGWGDIPSHFVMAVHEELHGCPDILLNYGGEHAGKLHLEQQLEPARTRCETRLYSYLYDSRKRDLNVLVISRERNSQGIEINAFDLVLSYDKCNVLKKVHKTVYNASVFARKMPGSFVAGDRITSLTQDVLARLGINTDQIVGAKRLHAISRTSRDR